MVVVVVVVVVVVEKFRHKYKYMHFVVFDWDLCTSKSLYRENAVIGQLRFHNVYGAVPEKILGLEIDL